MYGINNMMMQGGVALPKPLWGKYGYTGYRAKPNKAKKEDNNNDDEGKTEEAVG